MRLCVHVREREKWRERESKCGKMLKTGESMLKKKVQGYSIYFQIFCRFTIFQNKLGENVYNQL